MPVSTRCLCLYFPGVLTDTGWSGLAAIKTYRDVNPSSNVVLLESASSVGGVWAKHRLYKGLKSNNMLGTYEFSDFPMTEQAFGVKPGEHIPGHVIQKYMEKYAEHFGFTDRIRLETYVRSAEHRPDGTWLLTTTSQKDNNAEQTIVARKLIVATGITSQAYLPSFQGQEDFGAPLFHCRDLLEHESEVLHSGKKAAVFGGTKSAWDAVYACATSGMQVDWVIRESGHGPIWMAPPYVTPLKKWLEKLVTTRFLTWFSPCIWGDADGFNGVRSFLHGTWVGRKMVDSFWSTLANDVVQLNGYDEHPEVKKLKPWISPFWIASSLSILNYPTNFFDLVRDGKVRIHVADIDHLSRNSVHLANGTVLDDISVLICSTGWKATPNMQFLPEGIDRDLGFPWSQDSMDEALVRRADEEILKQFPKLRDQPTPNPQYRPLSDDAPATATHPFRLTRFIVPPSLMHERSVAFMGVTMTINTTMIAQTQALWIAAYFGGKLDVTPGVSCPPDVRELLASAKASESKVPIAKENVPDQDEERDPNLDLIWETALHSEFGKYRYPGGFGRRNPDFVFDALPYVDMLLRDLGLETNRKGGALAQCFAPYGVEDYRGLVNEWKRKHDTPSV